MSPAEQGSPQQHRSGTQVRSNGRTGPDTYDRYPGSLVSPPDSPPLPSVTDSDLRNGAKLDFIQHFQLGNGSLTETQKAQSKEPQATSDAEPNAAQSVHAHLKQEGEEVFNDQLALDEPQPEKILKLSSRELYELTSSPDALPLSPSTSTPTQNFRVEGRDLPDHRLRAKTTAVYHDVTPRDAQDDDPEAAYTPSMPPLLGDEANIRARSRKSENTARPSPSMRAFSTSGIQHYENAKKQTSRRLSKQVRDTLPNLRLGDDSTNEDVLDEPQPSPMPQSIPAPPLSMPTYLQLELSSERPSPLYIHRSATSDFPYESSRVKLERLKNFMLLPPQLEQVLWFGALACMDAWLSAFTILPLRFMKAISILIQWWSRNLANEARDILQFVYSGSGRMWQRHHRGSNAGSINPQPVSEKFRAERLMKANLAEPPGQVPLQKGKLSRHARKKSTPSGLMPDHKADILRGFLILLTCKILMYFDASRMYHSIRGQAAIKLYVIYNVLEVCDRLFSALGQDVLECLFSKEALERKADGRSKLLRPFWLFMLALAYSLVHSTSLFYQVITLNVAVNSYSNALLTLLMSNQFVEIKSTVFKKFEKENLFQLTCADIVERFQLWLMLLIIASRNVVETGGLHIGLFNGSGGAEASSGSGGSTLPRSFTLFPSWTGQVLAPFFLVLGSEMLVDWLKHAYINKFNNARPAIYGRFLDVLAKDYYSTAFADQNLTRRLGLPVIPLACLFIRASVQTYHMFLATYLPPPMPSTATSLSVDSATQSAATSEALAHVDNIFRRALYGSPSQHMSSNPYHLIDYFLPYLVPLTTLLLIFLFLLCLKILLGMVLLSFARSRYQSMKEREKESIHTEGRRVGGWGTVEVDDDKRRWIYAHDVDGYKRLRERESRDRERMKQSRGADFEKVERYSMVAKRIW